MTEEEIETVAEELAKVGGVAWYPGRTRGPLLRAVGDRYRDRARVVIAALDRLRATRQKSASPESPGAGDLDTGDKPTVDTEDQLQVGAIVVYRPPGDQRAIPCRVEKLEEGRAYLVPCPRPNVGWVSMDSLVPLGKEITDGNK